MSKPSVCALIAFCGHIVSSTDSRADTDILALLNDVLSHKSQILRSRTIMVPVTDCPWSGDAGPHLGHPPCITENQAQNQQYLDIARVKNGVVIKTDQVTFDKADATTLPETAIVGRLFYYNCGDSAFNPSQALTLSGTKGWSVTKTQGISSTTSVSLGGSFSAGVFGTQLSFSHSIGLSESTASSESSSQSDSRTVSGSVSNLQKGQAGTIVAAVMQTTARVQFSANAVVDGDLEDNISNLHKASDMLGEAERTIKFTGYIDITGLSDATVGNESAPASFSCNGRKNSFVSIPTYTTMPVSSLTKDFLNHLKGGAKSAPRRARAIDARGLITLSDPALGSQTDDILPSVGPPDGSIYNIISSSTVTHPTPACGFNDISVMNSGNFTVEIRHYETWSHGTLLNAYDQTVETFQSCVSGP